jgi:hypothetical protein
MLRLAKNAERTAKAEYGSAMKSKIIIACCYIFVGSTFGISCSSDRCLAVTNGGLLQQRQAGPVQDRMTLEGGDTILIRWQQEGAENGG